MPARKTVDIDMDAKKPYAKLGQVFHLGFLSLTCDSFRVLRVAATVSRTVAPTKQRIALCRKNSGSSCKSVRLATRSADLSGCETAQIFNSWDSWDNTGIREPPNCSPEPTSGFFLTPMLARIWRRGGDSNPRWRFWPPKRFSKPPHSAALPPLRGVLSTAYHTALVYLVHSRCTEFHGIQGRLHPLHRREHCRVKSFDVAFLERCSRFSVLERSVVRIAPSLE